MNLDGFTEFDLLKAKSIDKTKLVQVKVTVQGKNGTFTRMQWKRPSDVTGSDVVVGGQQNLNPTTSKKDDKKPTPNSKQQLIELLGKHKRSEIMEFAKKNGVQWKENDHEGINWMRASMSIQKHMQSNPDTWKSFDSGSDNTKDTAKTDSPKDSPVKDSAPKTSKPQSQPVDKQKVKDLTQGKDKAKVLDTLKANGVSWSEHSHAGINWMRAMQALGKALSDDPSLEDKIKANKTTQDLKDTQKQLKDTQKQVKELKDLVSQIQSPTAQQVASQSATADVLKGITTDTMSSYEKSKFGDVISKASPESLRNYRTLGMCAGDKESEKYLLDLYTKYSAAIQGISSSQYDPNIDADPLRNKLQGVVNKQVVGVVKSSLKNVRKRTSQFTLQQKLLEPWIDPNSPLTDEQRDFIKNGKGRMFPGDRRKECQMEQDCSHKLMHKVLDKFKMSQEYGQLAEEYDQLLTEFDRLTDSNSVFQNAVNGAGNGSKIQTAQEYENSLQFSINNEIERYERLLAADVSDQNKKFHQEKLDKYKDAQSNINGDNLVKAAEIRQKLFDPKFTDLNANLYHHKMIATQLSFQYEINKDFVSEYPILSKDNLDKLDKADEDSLTNLALYAGMFKPSLTKGGKSAKDALMDKYSERQAFLDAYGGVTQVSGNSAYAENNEIRCKVSKADPKKSQEIIDNIAKDWDKQSHGGMKYRIKGVYEVSGLAAEKQFDKIKQQHKQYRGTKVGGKDCGSDMFYHGTGSMATSLILGHSGEFKLVKAKVGRMLGDGIYLADKSSKSAQYIGDAGYSRSGISGSLMVVEASLGDTLSKRTSLGYGHDSVFAGKQHGLLNSEWCVHDPHAVIPRYLVEMEIL